MAQPTRNTSTDVAGVFPAVAFAYGLDPASEAAIIQTGNAATGAGTTIITRTAGLVPLGSVILNDGRPIQPFATTAPITIADANAETVTPSAVAVNSDGSVTITGTFNNLHGQGTQVTSGTVGLQEAINFAATVGGVVVVDSAWTALGGTSAILAAATVPSNVKVLDYRGTNSPASYGANVQVLSGATGHVAITFANAVNIAQLTDASAGAYTLATPAAADNGKLLFITSTTAEAHTVTTAANTITNGSGTTGDKLTAAAGIGSSCCLIASNLLWAVVALGGTQAASSFVLSEV